MLYIYYIEYSIIIIISFKARLYAIVFNCLKILILILDYIATLNLLQETLIC